MPPLTLTTVAAGDTSPPRQWRQRWRPAPCSGTWVATPSTTWTGKWARCFTRTPSLPDYNARRLLTQCGDDTPPSHGADGLGPPPRVLTMRERLHRRTIVNVLNLWFFVADIIWYIVRGIVVFGIRAVLSFVSFLLSEGEILPSIFLRSQLKKNLSFQA